MCPLQHEYFRQNLNSHPNAIPGATDTACIQIAIEMAFMFLSVKLSGCSSLIAIEVVPQRRGMRSESNR